MPFRKQPRTPQKFGAMTKNLGGELVHRFVNGVLEKLVVSPRIRTAAFAGQKMGLVSCIIKGFPFFGFISLISKMNGYGSLKDIAEFFSFMRCIRTGGTSGPSRVR